MCSPHAPQLQPINFQEPGEDKCLGNYSPIRPPSSAALFKVINGPLALILKTEGRDGSTELQPALLVSWEPENMIERVSGTQGANKQESLHIIGGHPSGAQGGTWPLVSQIQLPEL